MQKIKTDREFKEQPGFAEIIVNYIPYWPLFVVLFVLSVAGSWFYVRFASPVYQTTARILIDDSKKGAEASKAVESLDLLSSNKIIENEVEVIQSKTLLGEVVKNLSLYAPIYQEGTFRDISAYKISPVKIISRNPDTITSRLKGKVYFTYNNARSKVTIDSNAYPLNEWVPTAFGEVKFVANKAYAGNQKDAGKFYFQLLNTKAATFALAKNFTASISNKLSSIIDLNLQDEVPEKGEDILTEVLKDYKKSAVLDKSNLASNALEFIDVRLNGVVHDLDSIEHTMQKYKTTQGATDIGTQGKLFLQSVSENDQKLGDMNMQLAALTEVESYIKSNAGKTAAIPSTIGLNDPALSQLLDKLYTSELEYENLRKTTGDNNPLAVAVADRIEKMKPDVLENVQNQKRNLLAGKRDLASTNNVYSSALQSIPQKERQLIEINRDKNIKTDLYNFLLQKREETALSNASNLTDTKIIDKPQSSEDPIKPKRRVIYLTALLGMFFAGIGFVFAREKLSRNIMFRYEIENFTARPIIGEIASGKKTDPIAIGDNKKDFVAEQFRKLRMTLSYIGINSTNKKLLVTSAISGEGKSFVALNLGLSLALAGKKVILLDFDLNNPSLNNKLNIGKRKGITDFLLDECTVEEIIMQTDLDPNLSLIPTGELPVNPAELMMNGRVEVLLKYLEAHYDYIVIDSAPVVPVSDAYILSPYCDATLFIIRHAYTPKQFVNRLDEENKINQLHNVAIVYNGVKNHVFKSKYYGYGYGYGYNYKYKAGKDNTLRLPGGKVQ